MKLIRYEINIWSVGDESDVKLLGVTKVMNQEENLSQNNFNNFLYKSLDKMKKLIEEF